MGVSEFHQFGAAERAAWPVGRAGPAVPSVCILGHELTLTRGLTDCLAVPAYDWWAKAEPVAANNR
eukprot:1256346-Alexandrium_andersonii.AAC.1